jgi:hypothetical protein
MKRVLHVWTVIRAAENSLRVGFVVREQQFPVRFKVPVYGSQFSMARPHAAGPPAIQAAQLRLRRLLVSLQVCPGIAKPEVRQQIQRRRQFSAVHRRNPNQNVLGCFLAVFNEHVEISVGVEYSRVNQLVLSVEARTLRVGPHQVVIGMSGLGVLIFRN